MRKAGRLACTSYSAAHFLPPGSVPDRLPCDQVPVGLNMTNLLEVVLWDPFMLYKRVVQDRNCAFLGDLGNGKSAVIKTALARLLCLSERLEGGGKRLRRALIIDRKGEYKALAEFFDCVPVVLGHGQCVNPFDDRLGEQQQLAALIAILTFLLGRDLDSFEEKIAETAYTLARATYQLPTPTGERGPFLLSHVRAALVNLPDSFVAESLSTRETVNGLAIKLAFALDKVLTGSLRGMFDGPTTPAFDWSGQVIDVVIHPDYLVANRELVYRLVVSCVAVWVDRAWQSVDPAQRLDFFVCDEAWDAIKARQFAEHLQDGTKLGRSRGLSVMIAFHGPSDPQSAGNAGDAQVAIASRVLHEVSNWFLFHMDRKQIELLRPIVGLTDEDADIIEGLQPHEYLLVLGAGRNRRRYHVLHRITPEEEAMVDTDHLDP